MNKTLGELITISRAVGTDPWLVQGGGGNTSAKSTDGEHMYIKASGTALKDMSSQRGWRRLRVETVLSVMRDEELAKKDDVARETEVVQRLLSATDDDLVAGARPSVEAHLHAMLGRYVIHLHPYVIGAFVNAKKGHDVISRLFKNNRHPILWVPYADPGFRLARRLQRLVAGYQSRHGRKPEIMLLEKHGLLVSSDTANGALTMVRKVISTCKKGLSEVKTRKGGAVADDVINTTKLAIRGGLFAATGKYSIVSHVSNDTVVAFMARADASRLLATGVLTPDELLYANGGPMWLDKCDADTVRAKLRRQVEKGCKPAAAFLVKGVGLFSAGGRKSLPTIEAVATGSLFIRSRAAKMGGVAALNKRQQDFINKWESESYRQQINVGAGGGALMGKIAVVTGAGSGLGRSIAVGLAREGALVAAADVDAQAAAETVAAIQQELPAAGAIAVKCDVTDEGSVGKAFDGLLAQWGGLDILVNAAGVAPAYSLTELPVDKWRMALEVNLTGYFLMARTAARIMIEQAMGGNIINLSSKTGLEASKDNTAYNVTKAGELHMARGWAMELGQHGVRVNSVCPGNVFEGSKIWNRQYISACAKKYGIGPEEVIPFYVNKTILKRELKGQDIADAITFLCSDKARMITGQVIVADGGQVMVR